MYSHLLSQESTERSWSGGRHVHSVQYLQTHVCSVTVCRYTRTCSTHELPTCRAPSVAGGLPWPGSWARASSGPSASPRPPPPTPAEEHVFIVCSVQHNRCYLYILLLCKLILHDVPPTGACLLPTSHVLLLAAPTCAARCGLGEWWRWWCQGIRAGNEPS